MGQRHFYVLLVAVLCVTTPTLLFAQKPAMVEVKGRVYDITQRNFLDGVSVMATNGRGTTTDTLGFYSIWVRETDSVYFSYQNRTTAKYPVATMEDVRQFNMALHVYSHNLPPVTVYGRSYRMDSLSNRMEYAKYFNWQKPNPLKSVNVANGGVGMDPNDIINLFRFRRNRQLAELQKRLVEQEEDKYIDFRFNKNFVRKVTGLSDDPLKAFMRKYRPPYDFLVIVNDLELGYYIQQCYLKEIGLLPRGVEIYKLGIDGVEKDYRQLQKQ